MADDSMTPDEAEKLIGSVGRVVNPSKGPWDHDWRVTGYVLDPADDRRVKGLKLETVERKAGVSLTLPGGGKHATPQMVDPSETHGRPVVVAARPTAVAPEVPARWFKPGKAEAKAASDHDDAKQPAKQAAGK